MSEALDIKGFVCPYCNKTPTISSIHTGSGKIVIECGCKTKDNKRIWDVEEYIQKLEENKNINAYDFKKSNETEKTSKDKITNKIRNISDIIRTYQLILLTQQKYPNNYYHNQSIINLAQSIEEENEIPANIDEIIKKNIEDNEKNENDALLKLKKNFSVYIHNNVEKLTLKGPEKEKDHLKYLGNKGFELISKIRFKHLKEINLARNQINNVSYLDNMLLPHLEILNLSYNLIMNIEPVAKILSEKMKEILLNNNAIEKIDSFEKSNFPELETLRVDNNKINFKTKKFKEILKKYGNKLIYEDMNFSEFNKVYACDIKEESTKLELGSKKKPNLLIDIYKVFNSQNKVMYLYLDDNRIQNASLLSKIPFYHLQLLDLSLNYITNIKFLKKMSKKCKDLQILYLNDNRICDISPLLVCSHPSEIKENNNKNIIFEELKVLTLKNNKFYQRNNNLFLIDNATKDIIKHFITNLGDGFDFNNDEVGGGKEEEEKEKENNLIDATNDINTNTDNNTENNINNEKNGDLISEN